MKKVIIAIFLLFSTIATFAQNYAAPGYGFRLGLTAHPTLGWLKPETGKGDGLSIGFSYGLLGDFAFAENYSFSTGLTVTTINGKSTELNPNLYHVNEGTNQQTAYDLKYKLQYIEVPTAVKLKTNKIGELTWYGEFGLSHGFNIGARQDAYGRGQSLADDADIKDFTKFYRAGLVLGAGGEFDLDGHTSIVAGLTFNNGLTNIVKDRDRSVRNHYVGINFGVFF